MAALRCSGSILSSIFPANTVSKEASLKLNPSFPPCKNVCNKKCRGVRSVFRLNAIAEKEVENSSSVVEEEVKFDEEVEALAPTALEVESLLIDLCDDTSIAELQIKVGSFKLSVKRDVGGKAATAAAAPVAAPIAPPPVPSRPMIDSLPAVQKSRVEEDIEDDVDEGLAYVLSPRVGIFRHAKTRKGKVGRPAVKVGDNIKKGSVIGFLEQLGTHLDVLSEHAGEVVAFIAEDGDPVGFADQLISVRPSFPGIKKLT